MARIVYTALSIALLCASVAEGGVIGVDNLNQEMSSLNVDSSNLTNLFEETSEPFVRQSDEQDFSWGISGRDGVVTYPIALCEPIVVVRQLSVGDRVVISNHTLPACPVLDGLLKPV